MNDVVSKGGPIVRGLLFAAGQFIPFSNTPAVSHYRITLPT